MESIGRTQKKKDRKSFIAVRICGTIFIFPRARSSVLPQGQGQARGAVAGAVPWPNVPGIRDFSSLSKQSFYLQTKMRPIARSAIACLLSSKASLHSV